MDEQELVTLGTYLSELAGHKVVVRVPERGRLHTLARMVEDNARERANKHKEALEKDDGALLRLAQLCGLEVYPERIEAYDISNLGTEHLTAGMIVCREGQFKRSDYRTFHIKGVTGTDDYASMREALARRLSHLGDEDGSFAAPPDLILLDGGRGHVGVIRALLDEMGLDIPVFGMVKDDFHKTRALCTDTEEISIAREQQVFMLLYRIQEEVHRYTVSRMDAAKRKTIKTSSLEKIPGIGAVKAKALLTSLGGLGAIKEASVEQLVAVRGIGQKDAQAVYEYFHGKGN
jgi:excinuclease ABC subunit C